LGWDTTGVLRLQEEVIRAWEATAAVVAACAEAVHATMAYAQEATTTRERVEASIMEAEARATLAEREAKELIQKVTFLGGELEDGCQA
jgi:hypothetical protein